MVRRRWFGFLTAVLCFGVTGARADSPAVLASDAPVTVGQTMQNDASLADVAFVDAATGWAVGDRGVVWHTSDGGKTWQLQATGVTANLTSVCFIDRLHGWVAGGATRPYSDMSRGVLLATTDGGATWNQIEQATLPNISRLKFFDAKHGIAAGGASALFASGVFVTRDGGKTWQGLPTDSGGRWLAADFPDAGTGAVAGHEGRFATLMRNRVVNSPSAVGGVRAYRALRLALPTGGWLVGDGGLVMLTNDLGNSWQTPPGELPALVRENFDFQAVATAGPQVWIAGSPGTRVFHSADGGQHWQSFSTGQNLPLRAITFVDERCGYAVGDLGTILATVDGGQNWHVARRGGERTAMLLALADDKDVPLELVGRLGAEEGYLTAVSLLHADVQRADVHTREALLLAGATATSAAWQFPIAFDDGTRSPDELLAELNRANDGRAVARLENYLVRQLRMWRPDVVVTHRIVQPASGLLASLVEQLVDRALRAAADPNQYTDLAADAGLAPWQARKVYGVLPAGWRGEDRITTGQFAPRLGATLADWAEPARRIIAAPESAAPEAIDLQLKLRDNSLEPSESNDVFAGLRLTPGGDARRRLANLPSDDVEKLRRLATRRRQMRMLVERSQGNAAWAAQVAHLTDDLDPASAGELLFELGQSYAAVGKLDLAADTYTSLARQSPEHPLVEPALRWLVQFYASEEAAHRLADRGAQNYRQPPAEPISAGAVQQASAIAAVQSATPVIGLSRDARLERAGALGQYLEKARPSLFAEPSVRFPLVVAQRQLGFPNPAQRFYITLRSAPENDPWRLCGQTEEWFAKPGDAPPPKKLGNCRRVAERPHLDGQLDEALWQSADRLVLKGESSINETQETAGTGRIAHPAVRVTNDSEFLYLAVECPKVAGVDYTADERPRQRDAGLAEHDRVVVRLDVDRDYTTAFELVVDHRGWTHDACWGDATWNPTWFVAAAADDATWRVEAAIPLGELVSEPPTAKQVWAAAVVRRVPGQGEETWSGDASAGDSPDRFGLLIFE